MTEIPPPPSDRIEPVDLQLEMQRSFLDYAMSVIVARALPDVRDGLKPVHRRVLYAMYDSGFRPDRGYVKCSRVVGDVMGNYHPHGDSAIYDTLVRLAQPWSMRAPLIDGQGNFGSPGNDPAAAMRYCVVGDTLVRTPDGEVPIAELVPGAEPNTTTEVDFKVIGRDGVPVRVSAFHHSGEHPVLTVPAGDRSVTVTANHPLLAIGRVHGVPRLIWKLAGELTPATCWWCATRRGSAASWATALPLLPDVTAAYLADPARHLPDDGGDPRQFSLHRVHSVTPAGVARGVLAAGGLRRPRLPHQRLRLAQHRGPAVAAGHGDAARHRRGDRRLQAQLRRPVAGTDGAAVPDPEPAGQRRRRHRGRHGDQPAAAQPARGGRRRHLGAGPPGRHAPRSCSPS